MLEEKKNLSEDFKKQYDIDFKVFLNPQHPNFQDEYALEDPSSENLALAVKLRAATR